VTVHEHVQQVLSAWLDGQGDPDQRFLAERHLEWCAACQATVEAFARVDALAREVLRRPPALCLPGRLPGTRSARRAHP
jgi:anti-sigma factor RsiW